MKVTFTDMQDGLYSLNGAVIGDNRRLLWIMDGLVARDPFIFELVCDNGYFLIVGMGGPVGFAQYCHSHARLPCLTAMTENSKNKAGYESTDDADFIDFLANNTPTPVPARYWLPFELVKRIAAHFLNTGERSPMAHWEETQ